jgi:hypothetical protein
MDKLSQETKLALTAALMLAIGVASGVAIDDDDPKQPAPHDAGTVTESVDSKLTVDSAKYHEAIMAAKAAAGSGALLVDLLSSPVKPGEQVTTGVNLRAGARAVGSVELVGASVGAFTIDAVTYRDAEMTWLEVKATNTSKEPRRLTALVEVTP